MYIHSMAEEENLLKVLKAMTGESDKDVLSAYLYLAGQAVIKRRYPFTAIEELLVPLEYIDNQLKIAAYLINKRGAEGQLSHSENGIDRTYESADVPESMLKGIVPLCSPICSPKGKK